MSSSKGAHVQDTSVAERRLRPIYDWLDNGNNKKALQECDKVLKKTPNLHCAKALKALTLERMGKEAEAVGILDALAEEKPTDDAALQAMTLCYRELQQLDKICRIYEVAVKLDPNNEELYGHLFMSYARIFDFKSQHQAAVTLYKNKQKTPYYCWAVMSLILQATRGEGATDEKKRTLLLSLAQRMMEKLIVENKLDAEQEVQLYVMILELQQKYEEILTILNGDLGQKLVCSNSPTNKMRYFKQLERWNEINLLCKSILVDNVDRWDIWKDYINSVFELMASNKKKTNSNNHENHEGTDNDNDVETVDDTPEQCHEFICRIVENGSDNGFLLRGPYLARFELCSKLAERHQDPVEVLGETIELFIEYFRKFGHKPCCVSDLRIYLNLLDAEKKTELSTRLIRDVGISSTNVPQSEQQMQRHLCALQLSRLCGAHRNLSPEHLRALVAAFSLHYQHGYQTYGQNLLSTDLGPSDPYALLAAHVLFDLAKQEDDSGPIVAALALLDALLKNSPSNFHAKLLGIRLYHTIGAAVGAQNLYNSLDLKHLQLDSLGYIHCARLATSGLLTLYTNLCDVTLKFFSSNYKDSSDHITFSYKYGSFLKLDEVMDFRERLNNSLHYTQVAVDRIILTLMECTNLDALYNLDISPKDDKINWEALRDNHDLSVYVTWDPERIEGATEHAADIKLLFEQNVDFLKLRTSILWCLSSSVNIVKSTDGVRIKHLESLHNLLNDWEQLFKTISAKNYKVLRQDLATYPLPSRLHLALETPQFDVIGNSFRILEAAAKDDFSHVENYLTNIENSLKTFLNTLNTRIRAETNNLMRRREIVELIVNTIEVLSITCLVCLLCNDLTRPVRSKKGKRKGGGAQTATVTAAPPAATQDDLNLNLNTNKSREWLQKFIDCLKSHLNTMADLIQEWGTLGTSGDLSNTMEALNLNGTTTSVGTNVTENISYSHSIACMDISGVLKNKTKMLDGLVL